MMSEIYKRNGKMFRYDYDSAIVEYLAKADEDDPPEWVKDGYITLEGVGLRKENWDNKRIRDEYLDEWSEELDYEANCLLEDFLRFG